MLSLATNQFTKAHSISCTFVMLLLPKCCVFWPIQHNFHVCCFFFPASGHPHCFFCHLELGSDREVPSSFVRYVDVEFDMPTTSASKTIVRSISVEDKTDVRKWVNYSAHYSYKVQLSMGQLLCILRCFESCGQTNKIPWVHRLYNGYSLAHARLCAAATGAQPIANKQGIIFSVKMEWPFLQLLCGRAHTQLNLAINWHDKRVNKFCCIS